MEFQSWWVLKRKIFGQKSTYWKEIIVFILWIQWITVRQTVPKSDDWPSKLIFNLKNHPNFLGIFLIKNSNCLEAQFLTKYFFDNINFWHPLFSKIIPNFWQTFFQFLPKILLLKFHNRNYTYVNSTIHQIRLKIREIWFLWAMKVRR